MQGVKDSGLLNRVENGRLPVEYGKAEAADAECSNRSLVVSNAVFSYSAVSEPVLKGVSVEVDAGSCLCLMGMNGCGKSTLIDCVLGEHRLNSGSIEIAGRPVTELSDRQRAALVSYVPQIHQRTFPYTVRHIVLMGRTVRMETFGVPDKDDEFAAEAAMEMCGIAHLADRPSTTLSGGEMQMALLARALVQDTPLMLADEPTAHLDFRNELLFLETLEKLVADKNCAVLMATHAPNQAFHLAEAGLDVKVAVMSGGRIECYGTPLEVLREGTFESVFGIRAETWKHGSLSRVVPLATL